MLVKYADIKYIAIALEEIPNTRWILMYTYSSGNPYIISFDTLVNTAVYKRMWW